MPFDVATSAPMTISNFSRSCSDIGAIDYEDARYQEIVALIVNARSGPFLSEGIRVRMSFPDGTSLYIDDAGGVDTGVSRVKLLRAGFLRVKRILNSMARANGIRALQ